MGRLIYSMAEIQGGSDVDFKLELVVLPVSDVDRAKDFYADKMGFSVDVDAVAARSWLIERGVDVSEPFHFGPEGQTAGLSPERSDYNTFMSLNDPDGNGWLIQEVGYQAPA
jgi:catechol 2,3-dioxygenase-like lactoylglutathione lyase family enzyme